MNDKLIVIGGPTASGKTKLAIELAKKFNGEIINADSRSIYIGMDLGTGKPTLQEMEGIPHHLFDIVTPDKPFTLADYVELAKTAIAEIRSRDKIPFLVGGTGLYLDAIAYDFNLTESATNQKLREELNDKTDKELIDELTKLDPLSAEKIDLHNRRRVTRALEVIKLTNKSFIEQQKRKPLPKEILYLAVETDREKLYEKINQRVDLWMKSDFENEVKNLLTKYSLDLPAMSGIGYKQIGLYLEGKISKEEAVEKFKQGDRNLAKRQLTWFKRNKDIIWIKDFSAAKKEVKLFLENS